MTVGSVFRKSVCFCRIKRSLLISTYLFFVFRSQCKTLCCKVFSLVDDWEERRIIVFATLLQFSRKLQDLHSGVLSKEVFYLPVTIMIVVSCIVTGVGAIRILFQILSTDCSANLEFFKNTHDFNLIIKLCLQHKSKCNSQWERIWDFRHSMCLLQSEPMFILNTRCSI